MNSISNESMEKNRGASGTLIPKLAGWLCALTIVVSGNTSATQCGAQGYWVQVLGSGGPEMDDGRASSAYLVWVEGAARLLLDMGGGSALRFEQSGASVNTLDAVLFSHFHVDHSADFPALVKASFFTDRDRDLPVYGPDGNDLMPSAQQFINALFGSHGGAFAYLSDFVSKDTLSSYKLVAHNVSTGDKNIKYYKLGPDLDLSAVAVIHGPIPALAWRVDIKGHSVAFSGDMNGDNETLPVLAKAVNLLVAHNAIPENAGGVARRLHMPPSVIGKIARLAEIKALVLSHRMKRSLGVEKETLNIINKHYQGKVNFADDLDCYAF